MLQPCYIVTTCYGYFFKSSNILLISIYNTYSYFVTTVTTLFLLKYIYYIYNSKAVYTGYKIALYNFCYSIQNARKSRNVVTLAQYQLVTWFQVVTTRL